MRIVCISDTHEHHRELIVPPGDLVIHAGDFTFFSRRPWMYRAFDVWLGELPHCHKIIIPGNHEFLLEDPQQRSAITNAALLIDSGVMVEGLKIWGSPVTPLWRGVWNVQGGRPQEALGTHSRRLGHPDYARPTLWHPRLCARVGAPRGMP